MRQDEVVNPWAVCHAQLGKKKTKKFERCVMKVKAKHGIKENSHLDEQADYIAWILEKHTEGATVAGEYARRRAEDRPRDLPPTGRGAWESYEAHDAKVRGRQHRASLSGRRAASRAEGGGTVMSKLGPAAAERKRRGVHRGSTLAPRERLRRSSAQTQTQRSTGEPAGTPGARVTKPTGEYAPEIDLTSRGMKTVHQRKSGGAPGEFAESRPRASRRHAQGLRPVGDHTEYEGPSLSETKDWIQKAINPDHKGYCTPMTKETCTPARKAFAKRAKRGDI
jgi:hypothetical protein